MVIPLHTFEDWRPILTDLPQFIPGEDPLLVLSPHPDDETLGAGGLIASQRTLGREVKLVAITDGENAYIDNAGLADLRNHEQTLAAGLLGLAERDIIRLHLPDSDVRSHFKSLLSQLLPHVTDRTHILAPWPHDFHPDHEVCGLAAQRAANEAGCRLTFYFFWTWHRGTPNLLKGLPLSAFPLSADQQATKAAALAMHVSQLHHATEDPILHNIHLWPAQLPFEVYLPA